MVILRGFPPSNHVTGWGFTFRSGACLPTARYKVKNVSGEDIPMKIIRDDGRMIEDVFRAEEVCRGLTMKTIHKLQYLRRVKSGMPYVMA